MLLTINASNAQRCHLAIFTSLDPTYRCREEEILTFSASLDLNTLLNLRIEYRHHAAFEVQFSAILPRYIFDVHKSR